ncbi:hypothetical protein KP509_12G025200 [Ceratopteris richardii]|uniref:Uncharacterized protein n=1 Tax=Ceratopteris richardii TaxID=49495 RepID=A0A8T2TQE7_CERRI|nr:hypothetical protein KP509_12G025200 [Ceratopteris richardii]
MVKDQIQAVATVRRRPKDRRPEGFGTATPWIASGEQSSTPFSQISSVLPVLLPRKFIQAQQNIEVGDVALLFDARQIEDPSALPSRPLSRPHMAHWLFKDMVSLYCSRLLSGDGALGGPKQGKPHMLFCVGRNSKHGKPQICSP